ncbi:MAG: peptide deformylase [Gammaproteobacteria bacterium]|nr:peptide deformylase [Gammaproteobacteria bacterium]
MAVKEVLRMGHPVLAGVAEPVVRFDDELRALVADMFDTMAACKGAGLAAPQIGVPLRLVIFEVEANPRYPDAGDVPQTILINPELEPLGDDRLESWEGCLSLPGMRGLVPRYARLRYRGLDLAGQPFEREVEGFHAIVVQHECDHLDGVLYPQRIRDLRDFGFEQALFPRLSSGAEPDQ